MKKEVVVVSLGGSLIIPGEKPNILLLKKFRKVIQNNLLENSFVIVFGGGFRARKQISLLRKKGASKKEQALAGINATKENARLVMSFFHDSNKQLPKSKEEIKKMLKKYPIVICGALKYAKNETSDSTAAQIAGMFESKFINLTNVKGLYTSDPKKNTSAKFIKKISWERFEKMANKIKYLPGQHFVLDQKAASIIKKNRIDTYLVGKNLSNMNKLIKKKKFVGTTISG